MKYAYLAVALLWTAVVAIVMFDGGYRQMRVVLGGTATCLTLWSVTWQRWQRARNIPAEAEQPDA